MWWVLLGWFVVVAVLGAADVIFPALEPYVTPAAVLFSFLFALEANNLRRWTLGRRGHAFAGVGVGRSREECEHSFFARWDGAGRPRGSAMRAGVPVAGRHADDDTAFGLFPRPR